MVLGGQLRRLREDRNISREEAGEAIRGSESKISRLELGRVSLKERDVSDLLALYGVTDGDERDAFLDLVRESNQPGWWHRYHDLLPRWFQDYVGLEESASRIQTYEVAFVPGLVQTEQYARAVVRRGLPDAPADEIERRVSLRMRRQNLLAEPSTCRLWAVVDEGVLHRAVGGTDVLREQLKHMLEVTTQPNISLQVVPFRFGGSAAESSFTLLRFAEPELPDIVYLEHLCGALYLDKSDEVETYTKVAQRLAVEAETPDESRRTLERALSALS
ncbi:MAG TPA: helix-turn-helix transcriptional regulator [Pseudonocardiaceae bacterium]|jgi:transcriptional regulator with XRE-family HTH domain|nr:helix-turn-helix transcriptional regulator [Pseudonocardiaceae bacterium]